ncbi:monocarboxylate transporter 14-like [Acanthaster planci]|uniref:Monocarboxylate transporter 14-like n=1 Tax=Acanthaster planci TaxID=133434 RepID=A0A8B7YX03_ACAPL|nr:monocarboxylate transporter 14-like [Acanthaster planci]
MVAAAGLAHLMGVLLSSMVVFKKIVTSTSVMLVTVVLVSSSFIVEPLLTSGWLISINAIVYVAGMAAVFAIGDVMVKEFLGIDRMANALGWMGFLSGVFRFFSGFVPGWIYDHSGSYDLAFFCLGAVQMVSAVPLLCLCLHNSNPCRKS